MDIMIVCGESFGAGAFEYALGLVIGLILDIALWTHYRRAGRRTATRRLLVLD